MNTKTPAQIFAPMTHPAKVAYFQRMLGMDLVVVEWCPPGGTTTFKNHSVSAERLAESLGVDWELIKTMITTGNGPSVANGYGTICLLHCGIDLAGEVSYPQNSGLFILLAAVKSLILDIDMSSMQKTHTEAACNRLADMKADIRSVQGSVWNNLDPHNAITNMSTTPVGFIRFHGATLLVVQHDGVEYVKAKTLSDFLGLKWRRTRETISSGDNAFLYGGARFTPPDIDCLGPYIGPQNTELDGADDGSEAQKPSANEEIFMRLDRSRMFLARVSTDRMRSHGNEVGAEALLALQLEWADALHQYETNGIAVKSARREARRDIHDLIRTRGSKPTPAECMVLTQMIADSFAENGYAMPQSPQSTLPGI